MAMGRASLFCFLCLLRLKVMATLGFELVPNALQSARFDQAAMNAKQSTRLAAHVALEVAWVALVARLGRPVAQLLDACRHGQRLLLLLLLLAAPAGLGLLELGAGAERAAVLAACHDGLQALLLALAALDAAWGKRGEEETLNR